MSDGMPIIIIAMAVILVVFALLALLIWTKQKKGNLEQTIIKNKKVFLTQFIMGLVLALIATFFMFDGDILGKNTAGISMVIGIVGICLIATSNVTLIGLKGKK